MPQEPQGSDEAFAIVYPVMQLYETIFALRGSAIDFAHLLHRLDRRAAVRERIVQIREANK